MVFGLSNTPATYQGYINKVFMKKPDNFVIVYLDNILIYTKNASESYIEAVYKVLDQL